MGARAPDESFLLTATDATYEAPAFIGNGSVSLLSTPLGTTPALSYLAGVYDRGAGDVPRIVAAPAWNILDVSQAGGGWLNDVDPRGESLQSYRQTLDMYRGTLRTAYEWRDGPRVTAVDLLAFISRADPALAVVHLRLVPRDSGRITVRFPLVEWPSPKRLALAELERLPPRQPRATVWYPGHLIVENQDSASMSLQAEGGVARVAFTQLVPDPAGVRDLQRGTNEISFDAVEGETVSITKFVGVSTSSDGSDPLGRAVSAVHRAVGLGYQAVLDEHVAAWEDLWATDVIVEGEPELQRVIHSMQFYLLSSIREDAPASIPPMGLSSAGFYGHVFWDADTWMFPPLLVMHPEIARSIVAFRSHTLDAAQRNARANGYQGAQYPWEADERGTETTPRFAAQNARSEIHISGDVALAQWQFYLATGDEDWLAREGFPVIRETADFWVSRVSYDADADRYHLRNVVSVDESLIGIDDDAYTNAVARLNLEIAVAASQKLGATPNPDWTRIAERLYIPFEATGERHRTYEDASTQTLSSAVPLLAYPLAARMSDTVKRNDLSHTVGQMARLKRGAMMSRVLYPVVAAELGDKRLVDHLLPGTYRGHLRAPFDVLSERPVNEAVNFVTGAGAFLQQVIFGWTGLRLGEDGLRPAYKPVLPSSVRRVVLRNFSIRGTRQDIIVDRSEVRFVEKSRLVA